MHINFHNPTQDYIMCLIFLYLVFVLLIWRLCDTVIENLFFSSTHKYFLRKYFCSFELKLVQCKRTSLLKTHVYILSFCYTYLATCGAIEVLSYTLTTHSILTIPKYILTYYELLLHSVEFPLSLQQLGLSEKKIVLTFKTMDYRYCMKYLQ